MQHSAGGFQCWQGGARGHDLLAQRHILGAPLFHESSVVVFIGIAAAHHLDPRFHIAGRGHLDRQAEAVQQLGAQLTLFGVARADQHKPRSVADRQTLPLHHVLAGLGDIKQQVNDVIL